jgi:hypothetical protein
MAGNVPASQLVASEIDVGHYRPVIHIPDVEQVDGILARGSHDNLKSAIREGIFDEALDEWVVFHDQNGQ